MSKDVLILLVGPTCVGKSTLERALRHRHSVAPVRSFTTRPRREGEVDGEHYDFVTEAQVNEWADKGEVMQFVEYAGYQYGSTRACLDEAFEKGNGRAVIVVEPSGVTQFRELAKDIPSMTVVAFFLYAPHNLIFERFLGRFKNDSQANVSNYATRLQNLVSDLRTWPTAAEYDFALGVIDDDGRGAYTVNEAADLVVEEIAEISG